MMKTCKKCGAEKPIEEFGKDSSKPDKRRIYCRECAAGFTRSAYFKNPSIFKDRVNKWKKENPEADARYKRKSGYGLTEKKFEEMIRDQDNCCACCGDEFVKPPQVDHQHGSDPVIVRGLLCSHCNLGIGHFKDSLIRLKKAIGYLQQFS